MASGKGPSGKGATNLDSYDSSAGAPMVAASATAPVKVIVATDKKTGPPKPVSLGGVSMTTGSPDSYWE